jgi:nickel/cobalt exporter
MMNRWSLSLAVCCLVATSAPVLAHPHLYSTMKTTVMLDGDGSVKGLRIFWDFDETYTKFSLEGLDANNNGSFEDAEIQPLTDENIKALVESKYFTIAKQKDAEIPQGKVTVYGQALKNDRLTLWFELPFETPVKLQDGLFQTQIYDPDFMIAFDYAPDNPVTLEGALPSGCKMDLKPVPTTEELDETRTMLADKPQDWVPEQPTDFGAMFAQTLVLSCE